MLTRQSTPTTVHAGSWPARLGGRVTWLVDPNVRFDVPGAIFVDPGDSGVDAVRAVAASFGDCDTVVGVGGGSLLDLVKLASLVDVDPGLADVLTSRGRRAGVIPLPAGPSPVRRRVLVPTTIGTGVEVSSVACLTVDGGKRLVAGARLRPEAAVLDPARTASLPARLLREGVLEALLRVLGPVAGGPRVGGLPDAEAAMLARELVAVGDRFAAGDVTADGRLHAAELSAATHTGWALVGRKPYAARHWYLANELSTVLGVRKMVATAHVVPVVWERILSGDERFGVADRLAEAWRWISELPPVEGFRELVRRWDLEPAVAPTRQEIAAATDNALRAWGGTLPMLAGLDADDIAGIYEGSVACST
ncbi:daptide-type RiPP biosynthesis dehydogenase [Lentzea sp. NBRC 102530]|uniref:daptide-type RiPP biosynthesis dehydogenase n=1 Tax=Lentzea sp. NBRC 102530 TaxID=3032201 RepID=UPI0024A0458A|nr:daptide-type RiPP biosynthesis dehydogenase [Lentzea sp. NBRC 102530]GLY50313.1 hypothetical protein Lesp01_39690 [Lentzea sp. NBRC 102530]